MRHKTKDKRQKTKDKRQKKERTYSPFFFSCLVSCVSCLAFHVSSAQTHISLILPFQTESSTEKLDAYTNAHDFYTASRISLDDDAQISLDFYEGALQALNEWSDTPRIELSVYDNDNSDSLTTEILKNEALKKSDIIIGSVSSSSAKLVADFCKQNKIVNIQPFTPSKTLTRNNPYHLKLAPTIDAHIDAMFNSIVDSFAGGNVIIYTPDVEKSVNAAKRFDTLFSNYNETADKKFSVSFLNAKDVLSGEKKNSVKEKLKAGKPNIVVLTSFDESFVNSSLRVLFEELKNYQIVIYGMPTWFSGEIIRLDYVNDFSARLTDAFFVDSSKTSVQNFTRNYSTAFGGEPTKYSYLGYDVMNFALQSLRDYGKNFLDYVSTERYTGAAYKFDIVKAAKNGVVNYYENRYVHVFKVQDYQLKKVWD